MRIDRTKNPKSSFLSVEKDMGLIIGEMMKNERLKRLLFHTTKDAMSLPNLTSEETVGLIGKNIKNIPKLFVDPTTLNYIAVNFDNFIPNPTNPEFRDNVIEFDIVCHFDQWQLNDFKLRPFRIAAEIDSMFDKKHLTGIGELEFVSCKHIVLTQEFAGLCMIYRAVHGEEDKWPMTPPLSEEEEEEYMDEYHPGLLY
jgi:hypothetical protein